MYYNSNANGKAYNGKYYWKLLNKLINQTIKLKTTAKNFDKIAYYLLENKSVFTLTIPLHHYFLYLCNKDFIQNDDS